MLSRKVTWLASAACASLLLPATASARNVWLPSAPVFGRRPVLVNDLALQRNPQLLMLSGDGSAYIDKVRWQDWGQSTATATGTFVANGCRPDCAGSHLYYRYTAQIVATTIRRHWKHPVYSTLTIQLPAAARKHVGVLTIRYTTIGNRIHEHDFKAQKLPQCVVPALTGDTASQARTALKRAHCAAGTINADTYLWDDAPYLVGVTQSRAGTRHPYGTKVSLTLKGKTETDTELSSNWLYGGDDVEFVYLEPQTTPKGALDAIGALPENVAIENTTTDQTLNSFTMMSSTSCYLVEYTDYENPTWTLSGGTCDPSFSASVSFLDDVWAVATFTGNSAYITSSDSTFL